MLLQTYHHGYKLGDIGLTETVFVYSKCRYNEYIDDILNLLFPVAKACEHLSSKLQCFTRYMTPLKQLLNAQKWSNVIMLVSHFGEYPCECKKIYSRQICHIVANIIYGERAYECNSPPIAMIAK